MITWAIFIVFHNHSQNILSKLSTRYSTIRKQRSNPKKCSFTPKSRSGEAQGDLIHGNILGLGGLDRNTIAIWKPGSGHEGEEQGLPACNNYDDEDNQRYSEPGTCVLSLATTVCHGTETPTHPTADDVPGSQTLVLLRWPASHLHQHILIHTPHLTAYLLLTIVSALRQGGARLGGMLKENTLSSKPYKHCM